MRSDRWRPPDFRSLVKIVQTEQGRSDVSCLFEGHENLLMAKPMIFSEETGPTHFTFANQVGVQTHESTTNGSTPDELARTIQSHLWLANLEISSGCAPVWSATLPIPRDPHPDGPSIMTWHQLEDVHKAIVTAHRERNVSGMLKGVVSNMHLLAKFTREAGFLPYIGHAHYIYECYLKSQINSSRPPSVVTLALFGLFRQIWTGTCLCCVPWPCNHLCDHKIRMALPSMPLEHPGRMSAGCHCIIVPNSVCHHSH